MNAITVFSSQLGLQNTMLGSQISMAITSYASAGKEFQWLLSAFTGIVMCKIVYELTGIVSLSLFKEYAKLKDAVKVEWNNRGFSTFHAHVVAIASLYLLLLSDLFDEGIHNELMINRRSTLSDTVLGGLGDRALSARLE
ncbi:hypothetical protein U1Q18_043968, partial [Sarracenia purpurea var. burkii]